LKQEAAWSQKGTAWRVIPKNKNKALILHGFFVLPKLSGRWCHHLDGFGARKETGGACVHGPERICVPLKVRDPEKAYGRPLEDPV